MAISPRAKRILSKYSTSNPELNQRTDIKVKGKKGSPSKIVKKTYQLGEGMTGKGKRIQKEVINLKKHTKKVKGNYGTVPPIQIVKKSEIIGRGY